jgi:hypothetical protein
VFAELVADIRTRNGISLKSEVRQTYVTVPPLPVNFVVFRAESLLDRTARFADRCCHHLGQVINGLFHVQVASVQ